MLLFLNVSLFHLLGLLLMALFHLLPLGLVVILLLPLLMFLFLALLELLVILLLPFVELLALLLILPVLLGVAGVDGLRRFVRLKIVRMNGRTGRVTSYAGGWIVMCGRSRFAHPFVEDCGLAGGSDGRSAVIVTCA